MKTTQPTSPRRLLAPMIAALAISAVLPVTQAANITKASTGTDLTANASWSGGFAPGRFDVATWASSSLGASLTLGSSVSWQGISVANGAPAVGISGAGTLTNGIGGIDLSAASNNFTNSASLALSAGSQTWNVANGLTLVLNTGSFSRTTGATVNRVGLGTVSASLTGLAVDATKPAGNLGNWLFVNGTNYATLSSGNIVSYTGGTNLNTWGFSDTTGNTNYNITAASGTTYGASSRNANTVRYTGASDTVTLGNNNSGAQLIANGIINAGTGTLTLANGAGSLAGAGLAPGTSKELILNAATGPINVSSRVHNSSSGSSTIVLAGTFPITLSGTNDYTATYIENGATAIFGNNAFSNSISGGGAISNTVAGAAAVFTGDSTGFTGTLTQNSTGNSQFNTNTAGSANANYILTAGEIIFAANGDYTVRLGSLSSASAPDIRGGNTATGTATLEVGALGTSTTVAGPIRNGTTKILGLTKVGSGTLTLGGVNTYTAPTAIGGGKLVCTTAGAAASAITVSNNATLSIQLAAAEQQWVNSGTLTQNANSELDLDFTTLAPSVSTAPVNVAGLTINATTTLKVIGLTANFSIGQTYPLVTWSGSGPADATGITLVMPTRLAGHLTVSGNTLNLVVDSNTGPLSWNTGNGTWNTTTPNWVDSLNATATFINGGDSVLFADASGATGNPTVTLNSVLSPLSTTLNSSSHNYTISGAGGIAGSGALFVQNGSLTLSTSNSYSGGTVINGGTLTLAGTNNTTGGVVVNNGLLQISGGGTLGSSSSALTVNSGTVDLGASSQTGGAVVISGGVIQDGTLTGSSYTGSNSSSATISATLAGAAGLTMSGAGTLMVSGSNTFTGTVTLNSGTVVSASTNALSSAARVNLPGGANGTLDVAVDSGDAPIKIGMGSGATTYNLISDRATAGPGVNHPLSVLAGNGLGGGTLNFNAGNNVSSGTASFSFDTLGLGAGSVQTTILTPSSATVTIGTVSKFNNTPAQTLQLDGTTAGNSITGVVANGTATVSISKQNSSTWTLSGANTYSGGTTLGGGQLNINNNSALGTGAFTISSGTIDNTSSGDVALGAIAQVWNSDFTYAGSVHNLNLGSGTVTLNATPQVTVSQNTLTVGGVIAGSGQGLTKTGNGTLVLLGMNTYTGDTMINGGKVASSTAGSAASAFNVVGGATNGIVVASAGGSWTNASSVTQNPGSELDIDFGPYAPSASVAPIHVDSFYFASVVTIKVNGAANNFTVHATYPLVTWNSVGPADATAFALIMPTRLTGHLSVSGNTLNLVVDSNTGPISWNKGNGAWDTSTANWVDSTLAASIYIDGSDSVLFDSASGASGNPTVTLNSVLSPLNTTMNSASHNYTITGAGGIAGNGAVAVQTGVLTLATSNSYSGGTVINGGTLILSGTNNTSGGITVNPGGELQMSGGGTLGGGVLTVSGAVDLGLTSQTAGAVTILGGVITNGSLSGASYVANNAGPALVGAALNGSSGLTKTGNGTLTLTANNGFTGNLFGKNGAIVLDSGKVNTGGNYCSIGQDTNDVASLTLKTSGTFTNLGDFNVGDLGASIGTLTVQDNAVLNVNAFFIGSANAAGSTASGTVNQTGGTVVEVSNGIGTFGIGGRTSASGVGIYNMTGGTLTAAGGIRVGSSGTGTMTISGSAVVNANGGFNIARIAGAVGTLNLDGGTVNTLNITSSTAANATNNFNGAIVKPVAANNPWISALTQCNVRNGGAIFDTAGFSVTISQALLHSDIDGDNAIDGGLTKNGAGTLVLSGANTYTGNTTNNSGTLEIAQAVISTNSTLTLASGAILQLDFTTTNAVAAFVLNGVSQAPGVYNSGNVPAIVGTGSLQVPSFGPTGPGTLTNSVSGNTLSLSWPAGQGWRLVSQTNSLSIGLSPSGWVSVPGGVDGSNSITIDPTSPTVFFRLVYP